MDLLVENAGKEVFLCAVPFHRRDAEHTEKIFRATNPTFIASAEILRTLEARVGILRLREKLTS
jgi:hypothetical protein